MPTHMCILQELLEQLTFAEECGKLIMPPCWKTGDHCTGKLVHAYNPADPAQPTTLLSRAHDRGLKVYPYTFRNEVRPTSKNCSGHWRLVRSKTRMPYWKAPNISAVGRACCSRQELCLWHGTFFSTADAKKACDAVL